MHKYDTRHDDAMMQGKGLQTHPVVRWPWARESASWWALQWVRPSGPEWARLWEYVCPGLRSEAGVAWY